MPAGAIVAIIVAVVVVLLVIGALSMARRRKLQQRFGPEYDRVVGETRSHRKADAELAERERRVASLDVHPLDETTRAKYSGEWAALQEQFVDQPEQAVTQAGMLVTAVMKDRGYPTEDYDQIVADLSVEHAATLDHYRQAHAVSLRAEAGTAATEELRLAMLHYRALFADLLGLPATAQAEPAAAQAEPVPQSQAEPVPQRQDEPVPQRQDEPVPQSQAEPVPQSQDEPAPQSQAEPAPHSRPAS